MTKNSLFLGQRLETKRRQRTDQRLDKKNSLFLDQRLDTQRQQRTVSSWVRDWIHRDDKEQSLFWVRGWRCSAEMTKNSLFLGQRLDTQRRQRTVSSWVRGPWFPGVVDAGRKATLRTKFPVCVCVYMRMCVINGIVCIDCIIHMDAYC